MAKEKFVRTKPHVNIGRIGCGALLAAGVVAVMVIPNLQRDSPPQPAQLTNEAAIPLATDTATPALPDVELPGSDLGLDAVQVNWLLYQDNCGGVLPAQVVHLWLKNNATEIKGLPGDTLLLLAFGPPDPDSDKDTPMYLNMYVIPRLITGGPVSIAPGETLQLVVELVDNHPDFAWIPVQNPLPPASAPSGDILVERWQANGIGHSLSPDGPQDLTILAMLLPEVAGLFKDTADGETGQPFSQKFFNGETGGEADTGDSGEFWFFMPDNTELIVNAVDQNIGAVYQFKIEGDSGEGDFLLIVPPPSEVNEAKQPPYPLFIWGSKFPNPAQINESDLAFVQMLSELVGWATVSGLTNDIDVVEYTHPTPCSLIPTSTPTDPSSGGDGDGSAPTDTPRLEPSRTPLPPRKPTDTPPRREETKTPEG